jgi:cytolysin-activating lysine-acyltransferase
VSAVLGEIVWLMSQSPLHKQFFISDLEWFAMTPILLQQFRTFYAKDRPIGVVLWATVSDEVAGRLAEGTTKLRPQDWKSGDKVWVMPEACFQHDEVIAPFGGAEEMVKDLKEEVFPTRELRFVAVNKDGKQVRVL